MFQKYMKFAVLRLYVYGKVHGLEKVSKRREMMGKKVKRRKGNKLQRVLEAKKS